MSSQHPSSRPWTSIGGFIGVIGRRRTYRSLLYLFWTVILGGLYAVAITVTVLSALASIVVVGLPVLIAMILFLRYVADRERDLTRSMLDVDITAPPDDRPGLRSEPTDHVMMTLDDGATWRGIIYLTLKSLLAALMSVFLVYWIFTSMALGLAWIGGEPTVLEFVGDGWTIDSTAEFILAAPLAVVVILAGLHLLNLLASGWASVAGQLLGTVPETQ